MNPMQMMAMLQGSNNPMVMLQQLAGQNSMLNRAMQMGQGKSSGQLQQIVRNLAHQKGMSDEQLNQFISQFGLKF